VTNNAIGKKNAPQVVQSAPVLATQELKKNKRLGAVARIAFDVSDNRDIRRSDNPRYISKNCAASHHQQPAAL
jgi:hypothetical protein